MCFSSGVYWAFSAPFSRSFLRGKKRGFGPWMSYDAVEMVKGKKTRILNNLEYIVSFVFFFVLFTYFASLATRASLQICLPFPKVF